MKTEERNLEILRLSDVPLQEVQWLWKPYIPFGKLTIIQGDPGEGKTTFALRLAAACTTGQPLPGMEPAEPFNVIYQTAEDGLGDENGFRWLDGYNDISADELLCGVNPETKTAAAEELTREILSSGDQIPADEVFQMAQAKGISRRTVNEAKRNIDGIVSSKTGKRWMWQMKT